MGDAFNLLDLAKSMGMKTVDVAKEVKEAEATASEASSGVSRSITSEEGDGPLVELRLTPLTDTCVRVELVCAS